MKSLFSNILIIFFILPFINGCSGEDHSIDEFSGNKGTFVDQRDGKSYKWVKIGEQIWMAENLAYDPGTSGYSAYDHNQDYIDIYGYLYNWPIKSYVPEGWHIPTDNEWTELVDFLANNGYSHDGITGNKYIAKSLATNYGWSEYIVTPPGSIANTDFPELQNKTGFSALPSGRGYRTNDFSGLGTSCEWWATSEDGNHKSYSRILNSSSSLMGRYYRDLFWGYKAAIRCIKD